MAEGLSSAWMAEQVLERLKKLRQLKELLCHIGIFLAKEVEICCEISKILQFSMGLLGFEKYVSEY